jgi:hypothetical protein
MRLTVKEMEVLCVFHAGTLSETLAALRHAVSVGGGPHDRTDDTKSLIEKLSRMSAGDVVYLAFEHKK